LIIIVGVGRILTTPTDGRIFLIAQNMFSTITAKKKIRLKPIVPSFAVWKVKSLKNVLSSFVFHKEYLLQKAFYSEKGNLIPSYTYFDGCMEAQSICKALYLKVQ